MLVKPENLKEKSPAELKEQRAYAVKKLLEAFYLYPDVPIATIVKQIFRSSGKEIIIWDEITNTKKVVFDDPYHWKDAKSAKKIEEYLRDLKSCPPNIWLSDDDCITCEDTE